MKMKKSNALRKAEESFKRQRQKEINALKEIRETKRKVWEAISKEDYHPSGHIRHWK